MVAFSSALQSGAAEFRALGFDVPRDVLRVKTTDQFRHYLDDRKAKPGSVIIDNYRANFHRAKFLAAKLETQERAPRRARQPHHRGRQGAAAQGDACDGGAPPGPAFAANALAESFVDTSLQYVNSSSIQSMTSPAAYLKHIYDFATEMITTNSGYDYRAIENRRPDLKTFVLSYENLDEEVTTLSLVNELLTNLLSNGDESAFFTNLQTTAYPIVLPYNLDHATVRESLNAISGLSLNAIARRGPLDSFGIGVSDFSLVPNPTDRLRLYGYHVELMESISTNGSDGTTVYGTWYGRSDTTNANTYLNSAENYRSATDLTFDEFRMLVRDDVNVKDENGDTLDEYKNIFARFLSDGNVITLTRVTGTGDYTTSIDTNVLVPVNVHAIQNICIRLAKRMGLPLYQLDWLLTTAAYSHPAHTDAESNRFEVLADGTALNVLANYVEWSERYSLSVDQFAAMLADINCYARTPSDEQTLMKTLFGTDAGVSR